MSLDITKFNKTKPTNKKEQIMEEEEINYSSVAQDILAKRESTKGQQDINGLILASIIYSNNQKSKENK